MYLFEKLETKLGEKISTSKNIGGGSIAGTQKIVTDSGKKYFLKTGASNDLMFQCEANGLKELEKTGAIRIPHVFDVDKDFLLIELIESGHPGTDFFEGFGRQFAELHRYIGDSFGFYEDNFIGHSRQINQTTPAIKNNWVEFYFENRLLFQFHLAEKNGFATPELIKSFKALESKIDRILSGSENEPVLLHGDLWSGNFLADHNNNPVIIDPAVYYGNREADLAMTKLFGGFSPSFYSAYNETYPLKEGHEYRENIYKLYHVFNHLNLFGAGYYGQTLSLIQSYL